jgi:tetratricopeptide (TPR) repeat protein
MKLDPGNARARVSLASIRADEGKDAEALRLLEEAGQADRYSAFPKESLGAYLERRGDLDRALEAYRAGAEIDQASAASHAGIARILARRGAYQDAVAEYDKAVAAHSSDIATLIAASEAHEKVGDLKKAMLLLERALVHVKDRPALWIRLARLYESQGRLEDAVAASERAIQPSNARRPLASNRFTTSAKGAGAHLLPSGRLRPRQSGADHGLRVGNATLPGSIALRILQRSGSAGWITPRRLVVEVNVQIRQLFGAVAGSDPPLRMAAARVEVLLFRASPAGFRIAAAPRSPRRRFRQRISSFPL